MQCATTELTTMAPQNRPHFSSAQISEYRAFAIYVLDSDKNKAKIPVPYGYDDYVYYEHKDGQHDGLPYSQPGMEATYVPAAEASTNNMVAAANATAVSTNNTVVLADRNSAVPDGQAFVHSTAVEFVGLAKEAIGYIISGGGVNNNRGRGGRGRNQWRASHWSPNHNHHRYRDDRFPNGPRDFDLRREHRDDGNVLDNAVYNDTRNENNKRGRNDRDREYNERDRREYYREDYHDRDHRDHRDHYRQRDDESVVSDYLKNHPDKLRELLKHAKASPDPADVLKLGGLNLDGKEKEREGEAGPSAGAYREKNKAVDEDSDAEGTEDGEAADGAAD
ncbi:hypothetical protein C8F04DRAFT_1229075 [Mycena alexandri]|uniref:Uncharacterized protein n=1 Tax=Mycena alexandri TaxID=1745969 RepID=A0AAD6X8Y9_9AGAR|nr:hypothetical protein C8F04DRAFT_1229075 [Mycena alexandri]